MAYKDGERTLSFDIPDDLWIELDDICKNSGIVKKEACLAMVRVWLQFPEEMQRDLVHNRNSPNLLSELLTKFAKALLEYGEDLAEEYRRLKES
jgi:hypothetical protein